MLILTIIMMWISLGYLTWVVINVIEGWPTKWYGPGGWKDALTVGLPLCTMMGPLLWVALAFGIIQDKLNRRRL